jgi:hypothetical protein
MGNMTKRITANVFAWLAAAGIVWGAVQTRSGEALGAQSASAVPVIFQPFYQGPIFPEERLKAIRAALPYDRISLELSGGMLVPGGEFKLTLLRSGDATLWNASGGSRFGPSGDFVGTVGVADFGKLSHLIARGDLERMSRRYATSWSDMQTLTVTVSTPERSVSVADYGGAAPIELWAVERAIEAIGRGINWKLQ